MFAKILTFVRSVQGSPLFANLALHAWFGYGLLFTLGVKFPTHRLAICIGGILAAALKEFYFDTHYEIPPQPIGSIAGGGALQDFTGYMIGGALAIAAWVLVL